MIYYIFYKSYLQKRNNSNVQNKNINTKNININNNYKKK